MIYDALFGSVTWYLGFIVYFLSLWFSAIFLVHGLRSEEPGYRVAFFH
jgi:hypothetical protein